MPLPQAFVDLVNGAEFDAQRAAQDDAGISATLNIRDQRGMVPIAELASYCSKGITGAVEALLEIPIGTSVAPGGQMTVIYKGYLYTAINLIQRDVRLRLCDVDDPKFAQICDVLIMFNVMLEADKSTMIAMGNDRQSLAEIALGRSCEPIDVEAIRKGNN